MSELNYKMEFKDLYRLSNIGELINRPVSISGALLHRMYAFETTKGKYAVKLLNPSSTRETLRYIGITQDEKDQVVRSLNL